MDGPKRMRPAILTNTQTYLRGLTHDRNKLVRAIVLSILAFLFLRSCIFANRNSIPTEVTEQIERRYIQCINQDDTPIWPGEPRQPECGTVNTTFIAEGIVPTDQAAQEMTRAICFKVEYDNPYWSTLGTTRHDVKWTARTVFKVSTLQNGVWTIYPDQEQEDAKRWSMYSCPAQ